MIKKFLRYISLAIAFVFSLMVLISCGSITVDEATFRSALTDALSNVTMTVEFEKDGASDLRTVRIVDGVTYLQINAGEPWINTSEENSFVKIINAISKHYDEFTIKDGACRADHLVLVDDNGNTAEIKNVEITFSASGNANRIYFEEQESDGLTVQTITLSDYGKTEIPTEIGTGESSGTGNDYEDEEQDPNDYGGPYYGATFEVNESAWIEAFSFEGKTFSAMVYAIDPTGIETMDYYRIVRGVAYYSTDCASWSSGTVDSFYSSVVPFGNLYGQFENNGEAYYCSETKISGASVVNISVTFDSEQRLSVLSYDLILDGEKGSVKVAIYDHGNTTVPTNEGADVGDDENGNIFGESDSMTGFESDEGSIIN